MGYSITSVNVGSPSGGATASPGSDIYVSVAYTTGVYLFVFADVRVYDHTTGLLEDTHAQVMLGYINATTLGLVFPVGSVLSDGVKDIVLVTRASVSSTVLEYQRFNNAFTFIAPPEVTAIEPSEGSDADTIAVTGLHFGASSGTLSAKLDGVAVSITYTSATAFSFVVPHLTTGPGLKSFSVTAPGGTVTYFDVFNYLGSVRVYSIAPSRVPRFRTTPVRITGLNFQVGSTVSVVRTSDGASAACTGVVVGSSTDITCVVPALTDGTYRVYVTTPSNGTASIAIIYYKVLSIHGIGMVIKFGRTQPANPDAAHTITVRAVFADLYTGKKQFTTPDTYDDGVVGRAWKKNHYQQIFGGTDTIRRAMNAGHDADGKSLVALPGMAGVARASAVVAISPPVGTVERVTLRAHDGAPMIAWMTLNGPALVDGDGNVTELLQGDTAYVSVGLAFDHVNVYGLVKWRRGIPNGTRTFVATMDAFAFPLTADDPPALDQPSFTDPYGAGSHAAAPYEQERGNLVKQLAIYSAEHDMVSGDHRIPLKRYSGYSVAHDDYHIAPNDTTTATWIDIGAKSTSHLYLPPSLVGDSGVGIAQASLAESSTRVYLVLRSLTLAGSRRYRAVVARVSDL